MIRRFFCAILAFFSPMMFAEEASVPSADETDRIINESIGPETPVNAVKKPVEKKKRTGYKKAGLKTKTKAKTNAKKVVKGAKKVKKAKVSKVKKIKNKVTAKEAK